jgi:hypothetical protein
VNAGTQAEMSCAGMFLYTRGQPDYNKRHLQKMLSETDLIPMINVFEPDKLIAYIHEARPGIDNRTAILHIDASL